MNDFFDINYWIDGNRFVKNGSEELKLLSSSLKKNSINSVVLTNKLSLSYNWNIGNNELLKSEALLGKDNIYFSFILVPEAYCDFDLFFFFFFCFLHFTSYLISQAALLSLTIGAPHWGHFYSSLGLSMELFFALTAGNHKLCKHKPQQSCQSPFFC